MDKQQFYKQLTKTSKALLRERERKKVIFLLFSLIFWYNYSSYGQTTILQTTHKNL